MDPVTIGLTAASVAGKVFGAIKSGKANKANFRLLNEAKEDNEAFRNNTVNRDFMDTNAAKGVFTRLKKSLKDANKTVDSQAAVNGSTAEAEIAAKSKNQENFNNTTAKIAEGATAYQQQNEQEYRRGKERLLNAEMGLNQQKAQNAANLASNAASLAGAVANIPGESATADPFGQKIV
nr:hypothetical protein [uncultured Draconibacterium sp.]